MSLSNYINFVSQKIYINKVTIGKKIIQVKLNKLYNFKWME